MKPEKVMQGTSSAKEVESRGLALNVLVKYIKPFKDETQTALFKDIVRTAQ